MTKKNIFWLFASIFCLPAFSQSPVAKTPQRSNILWITCEDISPFLPMYGDSTIKTPNLSRLAAEGVVYTNMFSTYGVCAPSRSSIITGMYPTSIGTMHMRTSSANVANPSLPAYEAVIPEEVKCFTEYLRAAGYYCSNNSKTDYQFKAPVTAWDENSKTAHYKNRKPGQPFFAVFNLGVTHESQIWLRDSLPLRVNPSIVPVPPYYPQNNKVIRKDIARNYDNIMEMDRMVGDLLDDLEKDNLTDSTIIFFYSDHGGPISGYKRQVYDRGTKVPFIIRYPDKEKAGTKDTELHSFVDLAPSMLSLLGLTTPSYMQGEAFLGKNKSSKSREYIYTARDRMDSEYETVRAIRNKQYRYVRNFQPDLLYYQDVDYCKSMAMTREMLRLRDADSLNTFLKHYFSTKDAEELYDLEKDPYELNNLAADKSYTKVVERMNRDLEEWMMDTRDKGLMQEQDLIQMMWPGLKQPLTAKPAFKVSQQDQKPLVKISCATPGASIAYRFTNDLPEKWRLYVDGIKPEKRQKIVAKAIRIGYKESAENIFENK